MGNEFASLDSDFGNFGISGINRLNSGRAHGALHIARVIDHQLVTFAHATQVLYRHWIGNTIPDGGLFFLQIGKAVNGGFGFEEVEHRTTIISPRRRGDATKLPEKVRTSTISKP